MSLWFTASALAPALREQWGLSAQQAGWLTTAVQLGFVAGTAFAATLNIPDLVASRTLFACCALAAAAANAALLAAPGFGFVILTRFLVGFFLAGVYPPAMKMIATWYREGRGFAIGVIVGALTMGKAVPYLLGGVERGATATVVWSSTSGAALAALLVALLYRDGPHAFPSRPFSWGLVGEVARHREVRLAVGGYLGHMWELYAMWTWLAAFLAAARGVTLAAVGAPTFAAIGVAGFAGCVWGGKLADRIGREWVAIFAMAGSAACALAIGPAAAGPWILVLGVALVWGFFVIADSAQFSALVTEVAPPHAVGTALTLQTSLGFLLTMASIQLIPALAQAIGWRWAFAVLSLGPALGIEAMRRLARLRVRER